MQNKLFANAPELALTSPKRIRANDPLYWQLREFLEDEAQLLDAGQLHEWLDWITDDIRYRMPVRVSVNREMGDGFAKNMFFFNDTKSVLAMRIHRLLDTKQGWVESPPSRTARFVSSVNVYGTDEENSFRVDSNILLTRSRSDQGEVKLLTARRCDTLKIGDEVQLARREIYLNQTSIDMHNLAIFL